MSCFPPPCVPAGVPGCAGQTHGPGREPSQAGSVDQRLPGCPGKDPQTWGVSGDTVPGVPHSPGVLVGTPSPRVPHSTCPHLPCWGVTPFCCPPPALGPARGHGTPSCARAGAGPGGDGHAAGVQPDGGQQ